MAEKNGRGEYYPNILMKRARRTVSDLLQRPDLSEVKRGADMMGDRRKLQSLEIALGKPTGVFNKPQKLFILSQVAGIKSRFEEKDRVTNLRRAYRKAR